MKCASLNCEFLLVFSLDCFLLKRVHPACAHSPLGSRKHAVAAGHSIRSRGGQPILDEDSCKSLKEHMLPLEKRGDCLTLTEFDALVVVKMKEQAYQRGINPATVRPPARGYRAAFACSIGHSQTCTSRCANRAPKRGVFLSVCLSALL